MSFKVKIQEVNVEFVKNGKNGYEVANVNYLYNGDAKTTKIMSFSNPQVFKDVQKLVGKTVEVQTTQNGKYTNWAKLEPVVASDDAPAGKSDVVKSVQARSTYETPEERSKRQLMIVRQSSISNAIAYYKDIVDGGNEPATVDTVLNLAQQFVDFVYGNDDGLPIEKLDNDIPE